VLVLVPESGDGIQTLKSGVMEIADVFVVNKADRSGADKLRHEIEVTLGIRRGNAFRNVPAHHGRSAGRPVSRSAASPKAGLLATSEPPARPTDRPAAWEQPVLLATAVKDEGVADVITALDKHHDWLTASGELDQRRRRRLLERTREVVERAARRWLWEETRAEQLIKDRLDEVVSGRLSPYELATEILDELKEGERI
jgi:LAO/AO transport system kinase